ncbi:hypothetical protein [Ekhidna sp.]
MKNFIILLGIAICIISNHLAAQNKQDLIIGVWDTRDAQIEIYKIDNKYKGIPIDSKGEKHPERQILNLEYKKDKWVGKIYSRKRDKTLDVACEVEGDKLLLEVSAGFVSRDLEWTRAK